MKSVRFILSAHPYAFVRGDATVTRLLLEIASDFAHVRGSALWSDPPATSPFPIACVSRPPVRLARLAARGLLHGRSLIHTRYDVPAMVEHLRQQQDDQFVAIHSYMAEPFLSAFSRRERPPLYVDYVVSEAAVLRGGRGLAPLRGVEARRTWRDEVRCCQAAEATGGFDHRELAQLVEAGVPAPTFLRICLPPGKKVNVTTAPNLLFLGDRTWYPNYDGLRRLSRRWPDIRRAVPDASLLVVGTGPIPPEAQQAGIEVLGFLDSLDPVWADVRALIAPLAVGGGVRVKLLEAAARGVPVIASPAAVGSLDAYLEIQSVPDEEALVETSVALLSDHARAVREGELLYESNARWWKQGSFRHDVATWLALASEQD